MVGIAKRLSASVAIFHAAYRGRRPDTAGLPVLRCVERILPLGIGVEIWLSERQFRNYTRETTAALRERLQGVEPITAHSNLSRWNPDKLRREIRLSQHLGASVLVVHRNTLGLEDAEPPTSEELRDIAAYARDHGMVLALENSGRRGIELVRRGIDLIGADPLKTGMGVCIDTGHAHRAMLLDGAPVVDYLTEFREVTVEVHVNDNEGAADLHLPPGEGTIDWHGVIPAIRALPDRTVICLEPTSPGDPATTLAKAKDFVLGKARTGTD